MASIFFVVSVQAHDPSEHTKKIEKPNCEAMDKEGHSKMDSNDPVMIAMMKKCMSGGSVESHHSENPVASHADHNDKQEADQHSDGHNH